MIDGPILALDLASHFGWCSGVPGERKPRSGSSSFAARGAPTEDIFLGAMVWCRENFPGHGLIAYESALPPIFRAGATNITTTKILFGLAAIAEGCARSAGIEIVEASVADVRKFFIGRANLKSKEAKATVFDFCRTLGVVCADYDQSDAVALWFYVCSLYDKRTAARSTPLFGRVP